MSKKLIITALVIFILTGGLMKQVLDVVMYLILNTFIGGN